jgi:hypothetical protein
MGTYDNTNRPPELAKIPDNHDIVMQKAYLREYAIIGYPTVELVRLDREETVVDELYLEATARRWMEPLSVKCLPEHKPSSKALTKYGLDESRDVLFHIPTLFLADVDYLMREPNDTWIIGDLIKWGYDYYEVKDQIKNNDSYWAQTNIPMFITLAADFYRHGI